MRSLLAALAALLLAAPALAQSEGSIAAPPVRRSVDGNGVDVLRGTFNFGQTDITIGGAGHHGLAYARSNTNGLWYPSATAAITVSGTIVTVTVDGASDSFTQSGSTYTPTEANGASLAYSSGLYVYTSRNGTVARFDDDANYYYGVYKSNGASLTDITYADGTVETYTYKTNQFCRGGWEGVDCPGTIFYIFRLQSVNNSNGYQLKLAYANDDDQVDRNNLDAWSIPFRVVAINNGSLYYDPSADGAPASGWPAATYTKSIDGSGNVIRTMTDALGRVSRYQKDFGTGPMRIRRPGASADNLVASFDATGKVTSVLRDGVTWTYAYSDAGTTRTTTVTDANAKTEIYVGSTSTYLLSSFTDELSRTTSYTYDANGRLLSVTAPEGNKSTLSYDARGNVTERRAISKTAGTPADIVTTAAFASTCANVKTCNQPQSTTDARNHTTDYVYDAGHGGVTSVTLPPPTTGAVRPQTRYSYTSLNAYYRQSGAGSPAAGPAMAKLTGTSACRTTASCAGGADEVKATVGYGPQTTGTANNLLPVTTSAGAGNGSLTATVTATYDTIGNRTYVDGPLSGTADVTRTIYDADREAVGVIGPDPDGAWVMKNRAVRVTYNNDSQPTLTERGTTVGQTDSAWTAFAPLQSVATAYDVNARKVSDKTLGGTTTYGVTQYSYDTLGRLDCTALRMNSAAWGSLPASACTAQTTGSFGPDRITKSGYDFASEVTKTTSAYGTTDQSDDATLTYTANGKAQTLADANNNLTTYEYDGFDRLAKQRYPLPSTPGSSSTTDYVAPTYDATGNVTAQRLRDGQSIGASYDDLNRRTLLDLAGGGIDYDITYTFDNLGRLLTASDAAGYHTLLGYDALGRISAEQTTYQTWQYYQYDLAGRRTRLTWPDGNYASYDRLVTGEVSSIGLNGGSTPLAGYAYDDLGRTTGVTRANGSTSSWSYDAVSRLTSLSHDLLGSANDLTLGFTYNPAGQIVTRTSSNDAYSYVLANQDLAETPNGLNQLTAQGSASLTYDVRGNLTNDGTSTFYYSQLDRLWYRGPYTLRYDPAGRLELVHDATGGTVLNWSGADLSSELAYPSGNMLRRYVPGADGQPLVQYEGGGFGDRRWLYQDERGSGIATQNDAGTTTTFNRYDDYGVPASGNAGRFGYAGQLWLPELGLSYARARMYAPALGRFMQTDPIGIAGGINLYAYVGGDPVNGIDPSGLLVGPSSHVAPTMLVDPCPDNTVCVTGHRDPLKEWAAALDLRNSIADAFQKLFRDVPTNLGDRDPTQPQEIQTPCQRVANQPQKVRVTLITGSFIAGYGVTGALGHFVNLVTGSQGFFYTTGKGVGVDAGVSIHAGIYNRAADLQGFNQNYNAGYGSSGSLNYSKDGKLVGGSGGTGGEAGASATQTETTLFACQYHG